MARIIHHSRKVTNNRTQQSLDVRGGGGWVSSIRLRTLRQTSRMTGKSEVMPGRTLNGAGHKSSSGRSSADSHWVSIHPDIQSRRANRNRGSRDSGSEPVNRGSAQSAPTLPKIPIHRQLCRCMNLRVQEICGSAAHKLVYLGGCMRRVQPRILLYCPCRFGRECERSCRSPGRLALLLRQP